MAIQYAGGTNVNTTYSATTRTELVDGLKAQLVIAGWSVVSGSSGSWKLESAETPEGHAVRMTIIDPGSGNCAQLKILNVAETLAPSQAIYLLPAASKSFHVLANQYQFFTFNPGSVAPRDFACGGVLAVPSFLSLANAAWIQGSGQTDTDTTTRESFRTRLNMHMSLDAGAYACIIGANQWSGYADGAQQGHQRLVTHHDPENLSNNLWRWQDGSSEVYDAVFGCGATIKTDESKMVGLLWDAFICSDAFAAEAAVTFDSKNFMGITNSYTGTTRGTLFIYAP